MTMEIVPTKYELMDEADSQQIINADSAIKEALVYELKKGGEKQLSYLGIKWLVLQMAQKNNPLVVVGMPIVELAKHTDKQADWIWYATIKVKNTKTGQESIGASEQPFQDKYNSFQYDPFGRTKAISKAERNAFRKQIPELEINIMLKSAESDKVKSLGNNDNTTQKPGPVAAHYLAELEKLKYKGPKPPTSYDAANLINELKKSRLCKCEEFKPTKTEPHICESCKLPRGLQKE